MQKKDHTFPCAHYADGPRPGPVVKKNEKHPSQMGGGDAQLRKVNYRGSLLQICAGCPRAEGGARMPAVHDAGGPGPGPLPGPLPELGSPQRVPRPQPLHPVQVT